MEFLGPFFLKNEIILSTHKHTLTSSFLIYIPLNTLNYLIALTKISSTILHRHGKSQHPCLVPD